MRVNANEDPISKKLMVIANGRDVPGVAEACTQDGYIKVLIHPKVDLSGFEVDSVVESRGFKFGYIWDTPFSIVDIETKEVYASYIPSDSEDPSC